MGDPIEVQLTEPPFLLTEPTADQAVEVARDVAGLPKEPIELPRPSPIHIAPLPEPIRVCSAEDQQRLMDLLQAVATFAWNDGLTLGVKWFYEKGGRPRTVTKATRRVIQRDDNGRIVGVVDEVLT